MNSIPARFLFAVLICPLAFLVAACDQKSDHANARTPDADNTATNVRDRGNATLTPEDQGGSPADREVTQKIRKALVIDSSGYSTTAKNIKIITVNGKVTLRGPVKTDAEKTGIVAIAKGIAGDANVDDQLDVKANP
ncbi:MAG: hyperosmotically inducible periplasmic protein [Verrucomicrobiota bacterium]